jgi:hypothetical protein
MSKLYAKRFVSFFLFIVIANLAAGQQLDVKKFAIWGGGANPSSYNNNQGVFFSPNVKINGAIGSHHQVQSKGGLSITGDIVSGNQITIADSLNLKGNLIANKSATNYSGNVISSGLGSRITGSIIGNGRVVISQGTGNQASFVTGSLNVPAPTNQNYVGPTPGAVHLIPLLCRHYLKCLRIHRSIIRQEHEIFARRKSYHQVHTVHYHCQAGVSLN